MIKNLLNYVKQNQIQEKEPNKTAESELLELDSNVENFTKLLKETSNKNLILKNYDYIDLKIIEFLNKSGRSSLYGQKAVDLSKKLSKHYNFFKNNIHLYLDEPIHKEEKKPEEIKIDLNFCFEDLRSRMNDFKTKVKENNLPKVQIENKIINFNSEIKQLMKISEADYKLKFIDLKNKLVNFYKEVKKNDEILKSQLWLQSFNSYTEGVITLINKESKSEQVILDINNKLSESKNKYEDLKKIFQSSSIGEIKLSLLNELDSIYSNLNITYNNHIDSLKQSKVEDKFSLTNIFSAIKSTQIITPKHERIKQKQNQVSESTVKNLTNVLNNLESYNSEKLKKIFSDNYQIFESNIKNTEYSLLIKSLLDELEKNIKKQDEEEKVITKRNTIAKESCNYLNQVHSNINDYQLEELQLIYDKNLENYNNYSKYTLFGVKINSILNNINDHISTLSSRKSIQENLAQIFLNNINKVIATFENYSVKYLSEVLEKSTEEYNKYYRTSNLNKEIETSIHKIAKTLSLKKRSLENLKEKVNEFKVNSQELVSSFNPKQDDNNKVFEIKNKIINLNEWFLYLKTLIETKTTKDEKLAFLNILNSVHNNLNESYISYLDRLSSQKKNSIQSFFRIFSKKSVQETHQKEYLEQIKAEPKLSFKLEYANLRRELNIFGEKVKGNKLSKEDISDANSIFYKKINLLINKSDKEYALRFVGLKEKLSKLNRFTRKHRKEQLFQEKYNLELRNLKEKLSYLNIQNEKINALVTSKSDLNLIKDSKNNFDNEFFNVKALISNKKLSNEDKLSLLNELDSIYKNLNITYNNHIDSLKQSKVEDKFSLTNIFSAIKSTQIITPKHERIKQKQNQVSESTVKVLTNVLNNLESYNSEKLKKIFSDNYQTYETSIKNTEYSLLIKSLLDELEKNIKKQDEEEKVITKRNTIAKESYNYLNQIHNNINDYQLEELQLIYDKNLENYNNYSKYTLFGVKINSILNTINDHINTISSRREIKEKVNAILSKNRTQLVKQKQNQVSESTVKVLTNVLNNLESYNSEKLKKIFSDNYQTYETSIKNTEYSLLIKSLLDELEKNIKKLDEEEKVITKRNTIAKESCNYLNQIHSNVNDYQLEELQLIYEKNLENYNNYSKYTLFGVKINSILNNINDHVSTLSSRKSIQENLAQIFLNNINKVIATFENYSVKYLSEVLEKSTEEYNKYYRTSNLNKNIEFSLQEISNTLSLLKILVLYAEKDLSITDNQRGLLRRVIASTYGQYFSLNSNFLFNLSLRSNLRNIEKIFNLEVERKLTLEEVNNKIISLNLINNSHIKLLISNLINNKPQINQDLKDILLELSKSISIRNQETLNETIVRLTEISNNLIPSRKKSLLELKAKLK